MTVLTLGAEIGGVGLALELATSVSYLLWVPVVGFVLWVALWRVKFDDPGEHLRPARPGSGDLRGGVLPAARRRRCAVAPGQPPRAAARRGLGHVLVLRGRPVRVRADPVRGVLLLLRRGRGALDRQGPDDVASQRLRRLPAGRPARVRPHGDVRGGVPPAVDVGRLAVAGGAAAADRARQARAGGGHPGLLRGHLRRGDGDRAVLRVHGGAVPRAGRGASSGARSRRPGSTPW